MKLGGEGKWNEFFSPRKGKWQQTETHHGCVIMQICTVFHNCHANGMSINAGFSYVRGCLI